MGGGEHGVRGRLRVRVRSSAGGKACTWWSMERCLSPSPLRSCARGTRPRRGRGSAAVLNAAASPGAREKGPKVQPCPQVGVPVCWGAHWREGVGPAWSHARTRTRAQSTARRRDHERHGAAYDGKKERLGQRGSARRRRQRHLQTNLSQPGTKAGITSGGAAARSACTFHLGSKVGASTRAGKWSSSPWWPRAVVQASVKCGGAARRWGGRRRWQRRDVEEVEEVGEVGVLGDGGSGSSHGRLRSSRRTALPRTAPLLLLPFTSLLLRRVGVWTGEQLPRSG
jgi:hypothetical protein